MQCFPLGLGQICRLFLSFAWGIALIARQLAGAISLCSQGTGRFRQMKVALEADHSQQNHGLT